MTNKLLSSNVVALLQRTPKKFTRVRRHIIAHGTLPKGLRRAITTGQFDSDLQLIRAGYLESAT